MFSVASSSVPASVFGITSLRGEARVSCSRCAHFARMCFTCSGLVATVAKLQHVNREDKRDDVCFICVCLVYLVGLHFALVVCFWN